MTNWAEYNEGLRRRGDLTVWISEDALALWSAPRRTTRGGQPHYSDLAIELCLTLSLVFKQPLRQTQGLMRSIARLLGVVIAVPDFSTLSRRGNGLTLRPKPKPKCDKPVQLVVDSTGLKIFGEGDWLEQKHKTKRKRRSWRKLHLGLDLVSGVIVCSDLTKDDVGDPTALLGLLDKVDGPIDRFLADGESDGTRSSYCANQGPREDGMAEVIGLQSAEPRRNPDGSLEDRHRAKAKGAYLRKSENRSQDWRSASQSDDRTWPTKFRTYRLNSVSGWARSDNFIFRATSSFGLD